MTEKNLKGMDIVAPCSMTEQKQGAAITDRQRRLLTREQVELSLALNEDQVRHLIKTQQITRIRIAGEERFDSNDIDGLIDAYKATAQRRAQ